MIMTHCKNCAHLCLDEAPMCEIWRKPVEPEETCEMGAPMQTWKIEIQPVCKGKKGPADALERTKLILQIQKEGRALIQTLGRDIHFRRGDA